MKIHYIQVTLYIYNKLISLFIIVQTCTMPDYLFFRCFVSLDPPSITSDGHTINVLEGRPASIPCPVDGNPQPNITWYKGNYFCTKIIDKSTLEFPDTKLSDSGWYTCSVENYLGTVTVRVHLLVGKLYDFMR